jgi:hypothetical protein
LQSAPDLATAIQGKTTSIAGLALAALCALPAPVRAEPVEEFYRGKQIVMLVASYSATLGLRWRREFHLLARPSDNGT